MKKVKVFANAKVKVGVKISELIQGNIKDDLDHQVIA